MVYIMNLILLFSALYEIGFVYFHHLMKLELSLNEIGIISSLISVWMFLLVWNIGCMTVIHALASADSAKIQLEA